MSLAVDRCLFSQKLAELVLWIPANIHGVQVAFDEVKVASPRAVRIDGVYYKNAMDAVHAQLPKGTHPKGLGADLVLYTVEEDGTFLYITDGDHPAWKRVAEKWESLHPLCTSGRRFHDGNHVSWGETSKDTPLP